MSCRMTLTTHAWLTRLHNTLLLCLRYHFLGVSSVYIDMPGRFPEDLRFLRSDPSIEKSNARARNADEESIKRRRDLTAKVMYAQHLGGSDPNSSYKAGELLLVVCSKSTKQSTTLQCWFFVVSGLYQTLRALPTHPDNSYYLHYDHSYVSSDINTTPQYLTLDDRRHYAALQGTRDDSCFMVVGSENSDAPVSPNAAAHVWSNGITNVNNPHDDVIASYRETRPVEDISPSQQLPLLSSSPKDNFPVFAKPGAAASHSSTQSRSRNQDVPLYSPRSRASHSLEHRGCLFRGPDRLNKTAGVRRDNPGSDPESFEIDCSNSDIEVRFINAMGFMPKEPTSKFVAYKVGKRISFTKKNNVRSFNFVWCSKKRATFGQFLLKIYTSRCSDIFLLGIIQTWG